jgi:hypothetical protein
LLSALFASCQSQQPQTGHQVIAAAVRALLDKSYAGVDYPAYQEALKEVETVRAAHLAQTPYDLRAQVEQILGYLRTAGEILQWRHERKTAEECRTTDPAVAVWTERDTFLRAALDAHTPGLFDVPTALTLLWDQADAVLRGLQLKSRPL